jgi:FAD/FMN-containing dehydrogenase
VRPTDASWPGAASWARLKQQVGGNLIDVRSFAHAIDLAAAQLRKIAPNAGSYVSESNYFIRSWQSAYWGRNYARLRAIKTTYDPDGLFIVHHGVGSEDWSADGFTRFA